MNINVRFAIGTEHTMAKGQLKVVGYYEEAGVIMMQYTINNGDIKFNKYVNVISIIYKWQKKQEQAGNPTTQRQQAIRQQAVQMLSELILKRQLKFGVELELCVESIPNLKLKLREAGVNVVDPNTTHEVVNGWKLVRDASIRTTKIAVELVSPPSTDFKELKKVCEVLKEIGAYANNSCGLHVHHEIKDLKRQQIIRIYNFYNKYTPVINRIMKPSRLGNGFCKPVSQIIDLVNACETKSQLLKDIAGQNRAGYYNNCRYYTLNLRSFLHYGTIEFRQHHGSTSYEEISNWILLTHKMIDRATEINNNVVPFESYDMSIGDMFQAMSDELKIGNTELEKHYRKALKLNRAA